MDVLTFLKNLLLVLIQVSMSHLHLLQSIQEVNWKGLSIHKAFMKSICFTLCDLNQDLFVSHEGGWKEIGISSPHSRQDSNLSSPFGSGTIGSDPYAHIPLKHAAEPKGNTSPWTRPTIMTPEVKKTQSEINEQPENDSLRRTNEHAQIQVQF